MHESNKSSAIRRTVEIGAENSVKVMNLFIRMQYYCGNHRLSVKVRLALNCWLYKNITSLVTCGRLQDVHRIIFDVCPTDSRFIQAPN